MQMANCKLQTAFSSPFPPKKTSNKPIIIDVAHCIYLILLAIGFYTCSPRIKLLCVKTINYAANKNAARNNNNANDDAHYGNQAADSQK